MPELADTADALNSLRSWPAARRLGPRRQEALFDKVVSFLDVLVLLASFALSYVVRGRLGYGTLEPFRNYLWIAAIAVPLWLAMARAAALTSSQTYRQPARAVTLTLRVHVIASLILLSGLYLLKAVAVSRLLMQTFLVISACALVLERLAIHAAMVRLVDRWWNSAARRLLVVGPASAAEQLQRLLQQRPHWGATVAGVVTLELPVGASGNIPVLGQVADLSGVLETMVLDEVVMADANIAREHGVRVMGECMARGLSYHTLITMPGQAATRHHAEVLGDGVYLLSLEATSQSLVALFIKRVMDIGCACAGLMCCGAAYVVFGPIISLGSPGGVIFRQERIGRNGRRFMVYKFRSMRFDAEAVRAELLAANEMSGPLFKLRHDPRVTPVGRFLRRTYLDELPQFWNVLKGEMSLVGTRPPRPDEVARYAPYHRRRLSVRPGITGLWQCQGNGRVSDFERVVELDCEYIDRWSLWLDVKILMRTCLTVLRLSGH